jgi:ribosomal protein S18 acetylase RimI-like enzyme
MPVEIERLAPAQMDRASHVLASAFENDELFVPMFQDAKKRPDQVLAYCRWTVASHALGGAVVETTSSLRGVCIWQPPNHSFPWWLGLRTAPAMLSMLRSMGRDAGRALAWFSAEERYRQELLPHRAHWFLVMLGVEPGYQQYGLGAALALHGLARADQQRVPAYVITNTQANVRLYAKMGFEVAGRTPGADDALGISTWRMIRPAR